MIVNGSLRDDNESKEKYKGHLVSQVLRGQNGGSRGSSHLSSMGNPINIHPYGLGFPNDF